MKSLLLVTLAIVSIGCSTTEVDPILVEVAATELVARAIEKNPALGVELDLLSKALENEDLVYADYLAGRTGPEAVIAASVIKGVVEAYGGEASNQMLSKTLYGGIMLASARKF
jgi:hypothetical protein